MGKMITKRNLSLLAILIMAVAVMLSCSKDIILEPLPSLVGDYSGRYKVTENSLTTTYEIDWRFSDQSYWMTALADSETAAADMCSPSGRYILSDNVRLEEILDGCEGAIVKEYLRPMGTFQLLRPADSLIMTQVDSAGIFKQILLKKVAE